MPVHAYAVQDHHWDHLAPIWHALQPSARGRAYAGHLTSTHRYMRSLGLEPHAGVPPPTDELVMVASGNELAGIRRAVLVEHGAGQHYAGVDHVCWAGGIGREHVVAFVVPREETAAANRARYPDAAYIVAGSPHVEALITEHPYADPDLVVAFTAHWEAGLVPEMRSAFAHYQEAIEAHCRIVGADSVVLHAHPRYADFMAATAQRWGVAFEPRLDRLVDRAWVLVADNSSVLYEWAAIGRPVVVLNAPWYRREITHGLRFWDMADVGVQVDEPDELDTAITLAICDPAPQRQRRATISRYVFGGGIAGAATRAAAGIEALL